MQNLTNTQILAEIKDKGWWQGSLIKASDLARIGNNCEESEWWVIASQTCNLYNSSFAKIPVFEIIAASEIPKCDKSKTSGYDPRILHIEAHSKEESIALELDIQKRRWLDRPMLAKLHTPLFRVRDLTESVTKKRWLDNFIGWLARSYNRVAFPDIFNNAMEKSRLKEVIDKFVKKNNDDLHGVYFSLEIDSEEKWHGVLGEMPPPYVLGIIVVVNENIDPNPLKEQLITRIFSDKVKSPNPNDDSKTITRAKLARQNQIRLTEAGIEIESVAEIRLQTLRNLVRYTYHDNLSDSSMAAT